MTNKNYITDDQFRAHIKDVTTANGDIIATAIAAASRAIDAHCGRYFYQQQETQYYFPDDWWTVDLGDMDMATTTGLTVATDDGTAGTYATPWTINVDFQLEPINQSSNGINPWPYEYIRAIAPQKFFPIRLTPWQRPTVRVVGTYGWPTAPPDVVVEATKLIAAQMYKMADAPLGVAGFNGWGEVRVKDIPIVEAMLRQYVKGSSVGIA